MADWTKDPAMIEAMAKALYEASPFDDDKPEDYLPEAQAAASVLPDFAVPKVDMAGLDGLIERLMEPADWAIERPLMELRTEAATQLQALAARVKVLEAENERLNNLINETANHWLRLQCDHPVGWAGAIDTAMEAACDEIRRLSAALGEKQ